MSNLINRIVTDTDVCPPDFYSHGTSSSISTVYILTADTSGNTGKKLIDILRKATSTTTTSSLSSTTFYEIPFIVSTHHYTVIIHYYHYYYHHSVLF